MMTWFDSRPGKHSDGVFDFDLVGLLGMLDAWYIYRLHFTSCLCMNPVLCVIDFRHGMCICLHGGL